MRSIPNGATILDQDQLRRLVTNASPSLDFAGEVMLAAYVDPHDLRIDLGDLPRCHGADRTPRIMQE